MVRTLKKCVGDYSMGDVKMTQSNSGIIETPRRIAARKQNDNLAVVFYQL